MSITSYDRAQLAAPLAFNDSEFSWYIFEGTGNGRRIAGLASIHRTGPRARSIAFAPHLIAGRDLPAPLRDLVPSWLPIVAPVKVSTDDRPLFSLALYDLDRRAQPLHVEREIEHADFDGETFSARGSEFAVVADGRGGAALRARGEGFVLDVIVAERKPAVMFGDGSPALRHGRVTTSYVQRPRLAVTGTLALGGETIADFAGEGVHDHQWLRVTVPNLKWIWPHLRLPDGRELTGYVIRDSVRGARVDADDGEVIGRGGWLIERDARVVPIADFDVRAVAHVDTARGRVPTEFAVEAPSLGMRFDVHHVVRAPFLGMRAFGDVLDGGIYEGPIDVVDHPDVRGWVEVMNAAHVRLRAT